MGAAWLSAEASYRRLSADDKFGGMILRRESSVPARFELVSPV